MFVSPPPISNIGSLSQSTTSSLDSGSFGRNQADMNIQQQTTLVSFKNTLLLDLIFQIFLLYEAFSWKIICLAVIIYFKLKLTRSIVWC